MKALNQWLGCGLLLLVCLVAYSCDNSCSDRPFTDEAKSYFLNLKVGDYWIYKNIYDGDLDSVYVVSQTVMKGSGTSDATCYQEYAFVVLKGFADSGVFAYQVNSWDDRFSITLESDIDLEGKRDLETKENLNFNDKRYNNVMTTSHCCISPNCGGAVDCKSKVFRMRRFYSAPDIGIIGWEAENYPGRGNVVYDLIRTNRK
jgi:hypothetical protein